MLRGTDAVPQFSEVKAAQFTVGTSAAALGDTTLNNAGFAMLQADSGNSGTIKIGDGTGQYVTLAAGDWLPFLVAVSNLSLIYAIGSQSGQKLNALITR